VERHLPDEHFAHAAVFDRVMRWGWMDWVLRVRARDVLRRSGLSRHLPRTGLLLDLGAGSGHLSEAVLRGHSERRCIGVDPAHVPPPRLARRAEALAFHALRADGQHLPFAEGCFDGAWIGFVLHHMPPDAQERVLDEAARVIRPGGLLVLLEDTPSNTAQYRTTLAADRRLNMELGSAPHHYRTPTDWLKLLPRHGFRLEHEEAFTRLFPPATLRVVHHRAFVCRRAE
jgi:ubiquinone/menaquinone biosynthesis C-methylase UbiE